MGGIAGGSTRLCGGVRGIPDRRLRRAASALALAVTAFLVTDAPVLAESPSQRAVVGTVNDASGLEMETEPGLWTAAAQGAPVLEGTTLRAAPGNKAVVVLGRHGVLGIQESSQLRIGALRGQELPLSLEGAGGLSFRLPPEAAFEITSAAAVVTGPGNVLATGQTTPIMALVTHRGDETTVRVLQGTLRVRNRTGSDFLSLTAGEEAIIAGADATPRIGRLPEESEQDTRRGVLALLQTPAGMVAAGAVAAGGGVGVAAAAGAFDGGSSGSSSSEPPAPAASPFRP